MLAKSEGFLKLSNIHKEYKLIGEVGAGTYGCVYKAWNHRTKKYYALKKIEISKQSKQDSEGFPITAMREIKILRLLKHDNIIALKEIIMSKPNPYNLKQGSTFLVFDYMEHDFFGLLRKSVEFNMPQVKCIMHQLLEGILYLHQSKVIHRDIKSGNILLNNKGEVKIADLGLSRQMSQNHDPSYTTKVVTLWYRAPELLFGFKHYSEQIDVWSVGCIMAELLTREVLFRGDNEARQLELILDLCGKPDERKWPELANQEVYKEISRRVFGEGERKLPKHFKEARKVKDEFAIDLLDKLLILNPKDRITVTEALKHPFFTEEPLPCKKSEMPSYEKEYHESYLEKEGKLLKRQENVEKSQNESNSKINNYNRGRNFQNRPYVPYNSNLSKNYNAPGNNESQQRNGFIGNKPFDKQAKANGFLNKTQDGKGPSREELNREYDKLYRKTNEQNASSIVPSTGSQPNLGSSNNNSSLFNTNNNNNNSNNNNNNSNNNNSNTNSNNNNYNNNSAGNSQGNLISSILNVNMRMEDESDMNLSGTGLQVLLKNGNSKKEDDKKPVQNGIELLVFSKMGGSTNTKKVLNPHEAMKFKKQQQIQNRETQQSLTGSNKKTPSKLSTLSSGQKNPISEFADNPTASPKLKKKLKKSPDEASPKLKKKLKKSPDEENIL